VFKNYWGTYISQAQDGASAVAEPSHPGWYRYRKLFNASSVIDVSAEIVADGGVPLDIKVVKKKLPFMDKVSPEYKQEMLSAVVYNLEAGLSAGKSFVAVADSEYGEIRSKLEVGVRVIQRGGGFADAMRAIDFFDPATIAILDAGERTGTMRAAVAAAIEHYTAWAKGLSGIYWAIFFLAIDFVGAWSSVAGNKWGFLPMMEKQGIESSDPEKKLEFANGLFWTNVANDVLFYAATAFCLALIIGGALYIADDPKPRKWIEKKISRVPYLGAAMRHSALASTMKVLSALLAGGVPLLTAINIANRGARNTEINGYWESVQKSIESGDPIARSFQSGMLDSTEAISLAAHTNQKQLALILNRIAERRQEKARVARKTFMWVVAAESIGYTVASILTIGYVWVLQNRAMQGG